MEAELPVLLENYDRRTDLKTNQLTKQSTNGNDGSKESHTNSEESINHQYFSE